jgi:putative membrane protein
MYIANRNGLLELIRRGWKTILLLLVVTTTVAFVYIEFRPEKVSSAPNVITGFITAIGFFLAFFSTQAYERWWEARKIWGGDR